MKMRTGNRHANKSTQNNASDGAGFSEFIE